MGFIHVERKYGEPFLRERNMKMHMRRLGFGCLIAGAWAAAPAHADLTHRYSFTTDASDSVGGANGTLVNSATVSGGQLQLNNPSFSASVSGQPDPHGYLSLPSTILPS